MIPSKLLQQLKDEDFWQKKCVHCGLPANDIEAEHALFYAKKQIQEREAIVPVRRKYNRNPTQDTKDYSKLCALNQYKEAGKWEHLCTKYYKFNWDQEYKRLTQKYT